MVVEDNKGIPNKPSNLPQICNLTRDRVSSVIGASLYTIIGIGPGLNPKTNGTFAQGRACVSQSYHQTTPSSGLGYYSSRLAQVHSQPTSYNRQAQYGLLHTPAQKHPRQGLLGSAPAHYGSQATSPPSAFSTMTLQDPTWHMDTGESSHLHFNASNLSTIFDKCLFPSIHVGDGNSIPVTNTGHSIIPSLHRPLHLHNILVTHNIIKNLICVRQFTRDNNCTIEFDAFGFSVKDFLTRHILLRCDSSGDLYLVTKPSTSPTAFLSTSTSRGINGLSHTVLKVLTHFVYRQFISCNKEKSSHICHACQANM
ncbi:hypothetical protein Tco_1093377 [Tanacetum coccineum]|uniref:Uncharacterized protein n=1 Tax=Tanacetum coccineum TaxID=301880 RepID=A0ABQ5IDW4_9ASTR